jgi:hypothetical protein
MMDKFLKDRNMVFRGNLLKQLISKRGGEHMSNNEDSLAGRSEELIRVTRKVFGNNVEIQADGNGSDDILNGIRVGKLPEEINTSEQV